MDVPGRRYLGHEWFEVLVVRLADDPVGVAAERPAGDGAHQRLLLRQAVDEEGHQLRQVRDHARHAALGDGAQRQNARLFNLPVGVEERLLEDGQEDGQQLVFEDVGQHVEGGGAALAQVPVGQRRVRVHAVVVGVVVVVQVVVVGLLTAGARLAAPALSRNQSR